VYVAVASNFDFRVDRYLRYDLAHFVVLIDVGDAPLFG
jgi:hypothetical protein